MHERIRDRDGIVALATDGGDAVPRNEDASNDEGYRDHECAG